MRFNSRGEPTDRRYALVKLGLSNQPTQYLEAVSQVIPNMKLGKDKRANELAYMPIAANYILLDRNTREFLTLLAERMECCKAIGRIKYETRSPIFVPEREAEILKIKAAKAKQMNLPPEMIVETFTLIMAESRRLQQLEWDRLDAISARNARSG